MKRYILFCGNAYYPIGGMWDCAGSFDTIQEAESFCAKTDWFQVVDRETFAIVSKRGDSCYGEAESLDGSHKKPLAEMEGGK